MIYFFHGSDVHKVRAKAFQWVVAARAKAPEAAYVRLTPDQLTEESLTEALSSQGLFFAKTLVLLDDPFGESAAGELVLTHLDALKDSPNAVAILAPKLLASRATKITAVAEKTFVIDAIAKKERGFNSGLVNALAARNREALWKEVTTALREREAPEALHGLLHWKARDLMQKGGRGWTPESARSLSVSLIELLSDSRGKDLPLPLALERFALTV